MERVGERYVKIETMKHEGRIRENGRVYVRRIWGEKERVGIKKEKSRIETVPVKADRGGKKE